MLNVPWICSYMDIFGFLTTETITNALNRVSLALFLIINNPEKARNGNVFTNETLTLNISKQFFL